MSENKKSVDSTRLKQLREKFSMTQEDLAEELNISSKTVMRYEQRGIPKSKKNNLLKMSKLFKVPCEYITGETDIDDIDIYQMELELSIPPSDEEIAYAKITKAFENILQGIGCVYQYRGAAFDFGEIVNDPIRGPHNIISLNDEPINLYLTDDEAKEFVDFMKQMGEMKLCQFHMKARRENGNS